MHPLKTESRKAKELHPYKRRKPAPLFSVNIDYFNHDNGIYHFCFFHTACKSFEEKF
jgi:hypothetical protein